MNNVQQIACPPESTAWQLTAWEGSLSWQAAKRAMAWANCLSASWLQPLIWVWGLPALICSTLMLSDVQNTRRDQGTAFGHCGIVAAASAVLADLEKRGILKVTPSCLLIPIEGSCRDAFLDLLGMRHCCFCPAVTLPSCQCPYQALLC